MNKSKSKYLIIFLLLITGISMFSGTLRTNNADLFVLPEYKENTVEAKEDTATRFPVKNTQITDYEDLVRKNPIDLKDPSNISTQVVYDLNNNVYLFKTQIDKDEWITPFTLNPDQYLDYSLKKTMSDYFKQKNDETFANKDKKEAFSLKDIKVNMSTLDRIFGPGGVQIKPQGYIEVSAGMKHTRTDNPTISEKNRSHLMFDFDEKIQLNAKASVGNKINFGLNYDTESTFDFDTKRIKLAYDGEEDEILKHLEAGNVSMSTSNSLISGGTSLFGIKADLQFGKLKISSVISQQETESKTVSSDGGVQTMPFEFKADAYDENQHFFIGHYFYDKYDDALSKLPYIKSPVLINKIEVWVTNKQGNFDKARNVVAFADMGEYDHIKNNKWTTQGSLNNPDNNANTLYTTIRASYNDARDISRTNEVLTNGLGLVNGLDYEKLENARLLDQSEYKINTQLGYISLNTALSSDQVLAVAFEYQMNGNTYKVGEFGSEIPSQTETGKNSGALFLKLIKPVSLSPQAYTWRLMMKNIYKLGATQIQKEKFRLNIYYQSDTAGTYISYLPDGKIKNVPLLRVMNLDSLNSKQLRHPDGIFDFVEGYTILSDNGRIIFPVKEPFGSYLESKIGNNVIAKKYVYKELYDSTLTVAQQVADKNKFKISGSYKASAASSSLNLGAMNVAQGSVRVTANGIALKENVDYTVDYTTGSVTVINQALVEAGTPIRVTLEDQAMFNMKRKTLLGLNLSYDFTKNFNMGATIMHMYEKPLTMKAALGDESLRNTLWGLNTSYKGNSQWLTNLVDKLPFVTATAPSQISFNAEFAQLIAGHYKNQYNGDYSYLDDFESAKSRISVLYPYGWKLAATPYDDKADALFPEARLSDSIPYGNSRAHLAWFMIDNLFTRKNSSLMPSNIKNDENELSDPFVRRVEQWEIYPNKDITYNESSSISTLNLSYYPKQRGVYNLDSKNLDSEGNLLNPEKRWGGISRKLDNTNFETSNIEYIEFWLLDPFVKNDTATIKNEGGDLYFNLGEISEDVLKDGKKFYENGLPTDRLSTEVEYTAWGKVPKRQSTVYAFDNTLTAEERKIQDAGLNGMTTEEELNYAPYKNYLEALRAKLSPAALQRMQEDPFSPFNDPSGDSFHYFRGAYYDRVKAGILDRYKYYNGTEGNTTANEGTNENYSSAATTLPDVEDLNQDFTMNESESYYQYKVSLRPQNMQVGVNSYIVNARTVSVLLQNGKRDSVTWYQFKIPVREKIERKVGNISGFKTIRFMRMFMTNFKQNTFLRFATLDLVRGDWRTYTKPLSNDATIVTTNGVLNVSAVNIEENGDKKPVNYVVPPGVSRIVDPNQAQLKKDNEQALSMQVLKLDPMDARAIYKNTSHDLRKYKRLQMFTHAEEIIDGTPLNTGEMTAFLRMGSDYTDNYYEYEIPLRITPAGTYSNSESDREAVWPAGNMFDFPLEVLTNLKLARNKEKRKAGSQVSFNTLYSDYDPAKPGNKISVIGNPSLSDVAVLMIGVRNNSRTQKSAEVWVNELRMTDYDEKGGWAAQANLNVQLSDVASVELTGRKETAGFGSIDQSLTERRQDDLTSYSVSTNVDIGRFLPEQAKISAPLYYSYAKQVYSPEYDPLDQDIKLKDALDVVSTKAEKDSIKNLAQDKTITKNFSLSNVRVNIASKNPMPYDPANFSFGYAYSKTENSNPTTTYDVSQNYKLSMNYAYSPTVKPWEPFKNVDSKSLWAKYPKSLSINYLPNNIAFNSAISRFYTETQMRDLESFSLGGDNRNNQFTSWSQEFYWDRNFSITWDIVRNLKLSLQTGTRAEIEEPFLQVNKKLNPDGYDLWKDEVMRSLRHLGTPLTYRQTAQATYALPYQNIPALDWLNSAANYTSNYSWDRGATVDKNIEIGNTIDNDMTLTFTNRLSLITLYNKSPFLKKVNEKFDARRGGRQNFVQPQPRKPKAKTIEKTIRLNTDSATLLTHGLNTKKLEITAKNGKKTFKIKYKKIDRNTIRITTKDTALINIRITEKLPSENSTLYHVAEYSARGIMSLRSLSVNYSMRQETSITGFRPGTGDLFGQKRTNLGMTPGLGFAFGFDGGEDYINKSLQNNWLVINSENISPAVYNSIRKFEVDAELEPVRSLKIRLNALHERNARTSFDFSGYPNVLHTLGGSFTMTTISIGSSFGSGNAKNGYKSKSFDKFIEYRNIIANRIQGKFTDDMRYPNAGFLVEAGLGNQTYSKNNGAVSPNSAEVLIPAFLAAYTGKNANTISFSPFPALKSILPNWTVNYDGLTTLPWFKDKFNNFRITHAYMSQYRVGSYSSHSTWVDGGNGFGFSKGVNEDDPSRIAAIPTSQYDISSVNLVEQFNPLFGMEGTLKNNMTFRARYNYSRSLNLNISAYQMIESLQKDIVIGASYKINEFNRVIGITARKDKRFSNDLNLTADLTRRTMQALIRKLEDQFTEATSGSTVFSIKLSAEYALSRALLLRAYFDRIVNTPLISAAAYPTANTNFGLSIRFTLN